MTVYSVIMDTWAEDSETLKTFVNPKDAEAFVTAMGNARGPLKILPIEVKDECPWGQDFVYMLSLYNDERGYTCHLDDANLLDDVLREPNTEKGIYDLRDWYEGLDPSKPVSFGKVFLGEDEEDPERAELVSCTIYVITTLGNARMDMAAFAKDKNIPRLFEDAVQEAIDYLNLDVSIDEIAFHVD